MKLGISELFRKNSKKEEPADAASVSENTEEGADANIKDEKPVDDMIECPKCKQKFKKADIKENMNVCMACGYHFVIPADRRVRFLVDPGTFRPLKCRVAFSNPLNYPDYEEKIKALQEKTGMEEAVYTGVGKIDGYETVIAVMSSKFLMGRRNCLLLFLRQAAEQECRRELFHLCRWQRQVPQ